jgi:hypothetical protein
LNGSGKTTQIKELYQYLSQYYRVKYYKKDPSEYQAILEKFIDEPNKLAGFLGKINWISKMIPQSAELKKKINMVEKGKHQPSNREAIVAFEYLKEYITKEPIIKTPDFNQTLGRHRYALEGKDLNYIQMPAHMEQYSNKVKIL